MAHRYVFLDDTNKRQGEREGAVTSTGAPDAGRLVALDAGGLLDVSVMPTGIGPDVVVVPTSENLSSGNLVNIYDAGASTQTARKADSSNGRKADGFVLANTVSPANATVYLEGIITGMVGLTVGANYYLDATGGVSDTPETGASPAIWQYIGKALSTSTIRFEAHEPVTRA